MVFSEKEKALLQNIEDLSQESHEKHDTLEAKIKMLAIMIERVEKNSIKRDNELADRLDKLEENGSDKA